MTFRFVAVAVGVLSLLIITGPVMAQDADSTVAPGDTVDTPADTTDLPTDTTDGRAPSDTTMGPAAQGDSTALAPDSARALTPELAKQQARAAAAAWLEHVDAGQFGTSWDSAATHLQNAVPRAEWIGRGQEARSDLRGLESRGLENITFRDSVAQIPGGQPVVTMEYNSTFEEESVKEAIVMTRQDSDWRVAGYRVVAAQDSTAIDGN